MPKKEAVAEKLDWQDQEPILLYDFFNPEDHVAFRSKELEADIPKWNGVEVLFAFDFEDMEVMMQMQNDDLETWKAPVRWLSSANREMSKMYWVLRREVIALKAIKGLAPVEKHCMWDLFYFNTMVFFAGGYTTAPFTDKDSNRIKCVYPEDMLSRLYEHGVAVPGDRNRLGRPLEFHYNPQNTKPLSG